MFDLKVINSVLDQLEEERGIPRNKVIEAIETALATAYKKEYGKRGQIIRAHFDISTGKTEFYQVKIVVDESSVRMDDEEVEEEKAKAATEGSSPDASGEASKEDERIRFNPEHHILLEDAQKIKKDAILDDELTFPLEDKEDYSRISAQTAKQVIIQKIREAEKASALSEFEERKGEIVHGSVQRIERGNIFVDLGRVPGIIPYDEQIPGERFRQGERIQAYLYSVEESPRGVFLRLSRSHPKFLEKLFEMETPELANGVVEIKVIAREPGSRSKIAVMSNDEHIDPVGSLVGQRGVRVSTVMSELGGEKIDVIEWSEDTEQFIEEALSPAKVLNVSIDEGDGGSRKAIVEVSEDQQSLAIGKNGQNVRLAAKLTGWKIDIQSIKGASIAETDGEHVEIVEEAPTSQLGVGSRSPDSSASAEDVGKDDHVEQPKGVEATPPEDPEDSGLGGKESMPLDNTSQSDQTSEEREKKEKESEAKAATEGSSPDASEEASRDKR